MAQFVTKKGLLSWRILFLGGLFLLQNWAVAALGEPHIITGHAAEKNSLAVAISFTSSPPINNAPARAVNDSQSTMVLKPAQKAVLKPVSKPIPKKAPLTKAKIVPTSEARAVAKPPVSSVKTSPSKQVDVSLQQRVASVSRDEHHPKAAPVVNPSAASSSELNIEGNSVSNLIERNRGQASQHAPIITEPVFATQPTPPRYPTVARKRGQEGTVWLDIWLDETGKKSKLEVTQSSGLALLDASALKAVSGWQFKPYEKNGIRTASRVRIPVVFSLN